jgi:hypothetical protein
MGTWGAGNFENDYALDYLGELMDQLVSTVEECFEEEDGADLDEGGEERLMPSVAIMTLLSREFGAHPPKAEVVARWKKRYLKIYDDQIDGLDPSDDFKSDRRKTIEETFDSLIARAKEF